MMRRMVRFEALLLFSLAVGVVLPSGCKSDPKTEVETLIEQGRYREAIGRLEKLTKKEEKGELLYFLGRAHGGLKDFYQADSYYRRALSSDSTLKVRVIAGYLTLGEELIDSKEDLAVRAWERILSLDPDYDLGERLYLLGDHHFRNQNYKRASNLYSKALTVSPLSPSAKDGRYRLVLSLQRLGELEEALKWSGETIERKNQDLLYEVGKIAYSLAEKSLKDGYEERAIELLRRTIEIGKPKILMDDAYFLMGEIHLGKGKNKEAFRYYREVLRLNPYQKGGVVQRARERMREISEGRSQ